MAHPSQSFTRRARREAQPRIAAMAPHANRSQALRRLEREHIALLLAISELESAKADGATPDLRAALTPLLKADLARAQYALHRAAAGQYGVCDRCGKPLSAHLLEVNPATTRCPACSRSTRA